jgi:hypothetical protein
VGYKLKKIELCSGSGCLPGGVLKPNEERELIVELEHENRAAIHGIVKFPGGGPVKNALVKLFFKKGPCDFVPITFAFTDECGQFLFGVDSGKEYVIKVFFFTPENPANPTPCNC